MMRVLLIGKIDKSIIVFSYDWVLFWDFFLFKEWTSNICDIMGKYEERYVGIKNPEPLKNVPTVWFHFYEAQEQAKWICGDRNQNNDCL